MLYLRLSGSILLLVSAVLAARHMNKKAEERLSELSAFICLIKGIRLEVDSFCLPISKILERIDKDILVSCGYREKMSPGSLEELFSKIDFKGERCRELFSRFSSDFGSGYRDEELRKITYYEELFLVEIKKMSEELPSKKKINITLCISAALAIVILMI